MKVTTNGKIARFNERDKCLFHNLDAESISEALRSTIKHNTATTLTSATPIVVNALIADVVLIADMVLIIEESILYLLSWYELTLVINI